MSKKLKISSKKSSYCYDCTYVPFDNRTFHHMDFSRQPFFNVLKLIFCRKIGEIKTSAFFENVNNGLGLIFFKTGTLNLFYKFVGIKTLHFSFSHILPSLTIITLIIFNCTIFIPYTSNAFEFTEEICRQYGLGSNWHCRSAKEKPEELRDLTASDILHADIAPEQKAIELNKLWETQIKRATITGSKKDIYEFLSTHNLITAKGIEFSRNVQKVIEDSPALFNSESYYKNAVNSQIKSTELKEILQDASGRYGLVFIYSSSCHHCARQLPILLGFKHEYKFDVLGITIDEHYFAGLDENIVDDNVTNDPLVQAYPTILLLDKQNPAKIFISKGLTTLDELEEKIAKKIIEREK